MAVKTNTKPANEVGIIGQMYEDRKTKKRGVLESRETKYKTLMLRDADGKSFNITYSTFKSNWRKYQGDEVIETSTQIEEKKVEQKKAETKAKAETEKVIAEQSKEIKLTTEQKVKAIRAVDDAITALVKKKGYDLKTTRNSKGGLIIRYKKKSLIEVWNVHKLNMYSLRMTETINKFMENVDTTVEIIPNEKKNNVRRRFPMTPQDFDRVMSDVLDALDNYVKTELIKDEKKETKTKEEK